MPPPPDPTPPLGPTPRPGTLPRLVLTSSLREAVRAWAWALPVGLALATGLLMWEHGDSLANVAPLMAAVGAVGIAGAVAHYYLLGVASVTLDAEGVRLHPHAGRPAAFRWGDVTEAWYDGGWRFRTRDGHYHRLRDAGFTNDDFAALSAYVHARQAAAPVGTLPGVLAAPSEPDGSGVGAVYVAQHEAALFWGGPFFLVCLAVGLAAAVPRYLDGTWGEEPMLTVFVPLGSAAFVALAALGLRRVVRRATFLPDALVIERFVLKPVLVPYASVTDGFAEHLATERGRFALGKKNSAAFWRLLDPHLAPGQLSGGAAEATALSFVAVVFGLALLLPAFGFLLWLNRRHLDLPPGWGELYYALAPFALAMLLGYAAARLRARFAAP